MDLRGGPGKEGRGRRGRHSYVGLTRDFSWSASRSRYAPRRRLRSDPSRRRPAGGPGWPVRIVSVVAQSAAVANCAGRSACAGRLPAAVSGLSRDRRPAAVDAADGSASFPEEPAYVRLRAIGSSCRRRASGASRSASAPARRLHPRAGDGRRAAREQRPSRHADGHGRHRHRAVLRLPALRRRRSALAGPRPLRDLQRSRLDAAVCPAVPDRRPRHADRADPKIPPDRQPHAGPSGIPPLGRHRDHHRPARPGAGQFRRHGAGRADHERAVRRRTGGPFHLCVHGRRLPDGRHQP